MLVKAHPLFHKGVKQFLSDALCSISDVEIDVPEYGKVTVDIVYGGIFFAIVRASSLGLDVHKSRAQDLIGAGDLVKRKFNSLATGGCEDNFTRTFYKFFYKLIYWTLPEEFVLGKYHRTPLTKGNIGSGNFLVPFGNKPLERFCYT